MDLNAQIEAATKAAQDQIDTSKQVLTNALDAADCMILQKAVDATIRMAQQPITTTPDPTT